MIHDPDILQAHCLHGVQDIRNAQTFVLLDQGHRILIAVISIRQQICALPQLVIGELRHRWRGGGGFSRGCGGTSFRNERSGGQAGRRGEFQKIPACDVIVCFAYA